MHPRGVQSVPKWILHDKLRVPVAEWLCIPGQSDRPPTHAVLCLYKYQSSLIAGAASTRHSHLILPLSFGAAAHIFYSSRYLSDVGCEDSSVRLQRPPMLGAMQPIAIFIYPSFPANRNIRHRLVNLPRHLRDSFATVPSLHVRSIDARHLGASTWGNHVAVRCFDP
jgi:hypothetical protein